MASNQMNPDRQLDRGSPEPPPGSSSRTRGGWWGLPVWIAVCFLPSLTAVFVAVDGWYQTLAKPDWNPPSWLFGPVWSALYTMMGIAAWLVWRQGGWARQRLALGVFLVQLVLNAIWTPLFFGMHRLDWAFYEIVLLWACLMLTIALFFRVHRAAGALLVPYGLWVSFAAWLNLTIWRMNAG